MTRPRLPVCVNPIAGAGRGADAGSEVIARLQAPGRRPDAVIVVGGDGMVHASVHVLAGTGLPMGLIPAGTGNDFARVIGLEGLEVAAALGRTLKALERPVRRLELSRVELSPLPGPVAAAAEFDGTASDDALSGDAEADRDSEGRPRMVRR